MQQNHPQCPRVGSSDGGLITCRPLCPATLGLEYIDSYRMFQSRASPSRKTQHSYTFYLFMCGMSTVSSAGISLCDTIRSYLSYLSSALPTSRPKSLTPSPTIRIYSDGTSPSIVKDQLSEDSARSALSVTSASSARSRDSHPLRSIWDDITKTATSVPYSEIAAFTIVPAAMAFLAWNDAKPRFTHELMRLPSAVTTAGPLAGNSRISW